MTLIEYYFFLQTLFYYTDTYRAEVRARQRSAYEHAHPGIGAQLRHSHLTTFLARCSHTLWAVSDGLCTTFSTSAEHYQSRRNKAGSH